MLVIPLCQERKTEQNSRIQMVLYLSFIELKKRISKSNLGLKKKLKCLKSGTASRMTLTYKTDRIG